MKKVSIIGASGYAGGEVLKWLKKHPLVEICHIFGETSVGEINQGLKVEEFDIKKIENMDVVFLALPHGKSFEISKQLENSNAILIDLSADHRLENENDWNNYYGNNPKFQQPWVYGLPELKTQRNLLKTAKRIAVPGCNVTAVTLGLIPLIENSLIEEDKIVSVLANGYSGAGKSLKPHLLLSEGINSATPYSVGGIHRHIPEILQNFRKLGMVNPTISFTPTLVPMDRGILSTTTVFPKSRVTDGERKSGVTDGERKSKVTDGEPNSSLTKETLFEIYNNRFNDEKFIKVIDNGNLTTKQVQNTNFANIQVEYDKISNTITTIVAIDNLVRGTAGQAIQSMNIALGIEETISLIQTL